MNSIYEREKKVNSIYTIEQHLKMYADAENAMERHKILWHAWNQNKRWLSQLLEWTLSSYTTYSYHNASHAETVIHNIERILGTERIRELSATDCFMILHTAYMHDIGMSISAAERENMMQDEKFIEMVEYLEKEGDSDMRRAAASVLQTNYTEFQNVSTRERNTKLKELFGEKLNVYYGLSQVIAEYQRKQHSTKVRERMHQWTTEELGNGFSVSGIPLRLFLRIADCASIHTLNGIEPVLELPKEDSGYALDMVHPRFIAVMIQIGDALDMDNDRFNPFSFQFAGNFPHTSTIHCKKHQAIRQLKITPEMIQIQADCESQEVLRLVRMECEGIEEILKNASYYWADICPEEMSGCLPVLNQSIILLKGQRVPTELVKAQFNISQVRAFRLLEGANVYGGNFVFLREVIQNAIDASKLQCWEDYIYRCKLKERKILFDDYENVEYGLNASEKEILGEIDVWNYPIELNFEIGVQIRNKDEEIMFVPFEKMNKEQEKEGVYGIRFTVRDHGTGISKEDLIKISNVGSSYEEKRHFIDKMPDWLKPTGQFGIGLQSVFLVTENMVARTYTRSGEKYEITFNKVSNGSGGYINVKPLMPDEYVTFGTTFEIFLSNEYKRPHADFWEAWNTESEDADRFINDYDKKRPLRHSQEMLTQMILYIDGLLGENLFPIFARIKGKGCDNKQYKFIKNSITKLVLVSENIKDGEKFDEENYISWLFKAIRPKKQLKDKENKKKLIIVDIKDGIAALDCNNVKLHIWNNTLGIFARFGASRMLSNYSYTANQEKKILEERKTKIYLKGIYVQGHSMYQDSELLELIDIKGGKIGKNHISINRNEFTKEGLDYLENEVYPAIISSAKMALVELNERAILCEQEFLKQRNATRKQAQCEGECISKNKEPDKKDAEICVFDKEIMNSILEKTQKCIENENDNFFILKKDLEETVLSAVGLSYFLRVLGKDNQVFCEKRGEWDRVCKWDELLKQIVKYRIYGRISGEGNADREVLDISKKFENYINHGMLHKMKVYIYKEMKRTGIESEPKILDYASMLLETRKVAIISIRYNSYTKWFYIPMLIHEQEENDDGKSVSLETKENAYEIFQRKAQTLEEEWQILEKMEHWADEIFGKLNNLVTIQKLHEEYGVDSDIQYTLNYMLTNIPTVALYTDNSEDGNVRINVLSAERNDSVFYNRNMKRLILKKVNKLYNKFHAKRFVTATWRSYECISLAEIPSSVCNVNGACIAKQQTSRMLLPILGEKMNLLLNLKEQEFFKEINMQKEKCENIQKQVNNNWRALYDKFDNVINEKETAGDKVEEEIKNYLNSVTEQKNKQKDKKRVLQSYGRELKQYIKRKVNKLRKEQCHRETEVNEIEKNLPNPEEFQRMIIEDFFEKKGNTNPAHDIIEPEKRMEMWEKFGDVICFVNKYRNFDLREWVKTHPSMEEFKNLLWEKEEGNEVQKNIITYVSKNIQAQLTEKQIKSCYEKMLDDMIECVFENEIEDKKEERSNLRMMFWE